MNIYYVTMNSGDRIEIAADTPETAMRDAERRVCDIALFCEDDMGVVA